MRLPFYREEATISAATSRLRRQCSTGRRSSRLPRGGGGSENPPPFWANGKPAQGVSGSPSPRVSRRCGSPMALLRVPDSATAIALTADQLAAPVSTVTAMAPIPSALGRLSNSVIALSKKTPLR